jgi:hypothetical protein
MIPRITGVPPVPGVNVHARTPRTILLATIALICSGVTLFFVTRPWWDRPSPDDDKKALQVMERISGFAVTPECRTARIARSGWQDVSYWYLFEMPRADVATCETSIRQANAKRIEEQTCSQLHFADESSNPWWWKPEKLPDAKVLHVRENGTGESESWFILSPQTGQIFYHPWTR